MLNPYLYEYSDIDIQPTEIRTGHTDSVSIWLSSYETSAGLLHSAGTEEQDASARRPMPIAAAVENFVIGGERETVG